MPNISFEMQTVKIKLRALLLVFWQKFYFILACRTGFMRCASCEFRLEFLPRFAIFSCVFSWKSGVFSAVAGATRRFSQNFRILTFLYIELHNIHSTALQSSKNTPRQRSPILVLVHTTYQNHTSIVMPLVLQWVFSVSLYIVLPKSMCECELPRTFICLLLK